MGSFNSDWGRVTFWISTSWRCKLYSNWTNVCDGNIYQAVYQGLMTGEWSFFFAKFKVTDVGVTRVLSWWVIPVCGEDWIAELADFRILLAISHQRSTAIEPQTRGGSHHERTWHVRLRHWRRPSQEEFDDMCKYSDEWPLGSVGWESGGAPSCHWPSRQQLPHVHPTNYSIQFWWWTVSWKLS